MPGILLPQVSPADVMASKALVPSTPRRDLVVVKICRQILPDALSRSILRRESMHECRQCDIRTVDKFRADGRRLVERQAFDQGSGEGGCFRNLDGFHRAVIIDVLDGFGRGRFLRTISRENEAAVDIEFAVIADADNRTGDGQGFRGPDILAVLVDRIDAIGDFAQAFRIFGVRIVVGVPGGLKRVVFLLQGCKFLRQLRGERSQLGMHPRAVRPFGVILLKPDLNPFPALLAQTVSGFFEFGEGKSLQKLLIEDEDAFVVLGEEIAADLSTGFLIGLEGDEFDDLVRGGDFTVGQCAADRAGIVVHVAQDLEEFFLRLVVVGDRERHDLFKVEFPVAVSGEDDRADTGEFQALADHGFGDAKTRGDIGGGHALVAEIAEGLEFIGGMHVLADGVLGQADFRGVGIVGDELTGDRVVSGDLAGFGELLQA